MNLLNHIKAINIYSPDVIQNILIVTGTVIALLALIYSYKLFKEQRKLRYVSEIPFLEIVDTTSFVFNPNAIITNLKIKNASKNIAFVQKIEIGLGPIQYLFDYDKVILKEDYNQNKPTIYGEGECTLTINTGWTTNNELKDEPAIIRVIYKTRYGHTIKLTAKKIKYVIPGTFGGMNRYLNHEYEFDKELK